MEVSTLFMESESELLESSPGHLKKVYIKKCFKTLTCFSINVAVSHNNVNHVSSYSAQTQEPIAYSLVLEIQDPQDGSTHG